MIDEHAANRLSHGFIGHLPMEDWWQQWWVLLDKLVHEVYSVNQLYVHANNRVITYRIIVRVLFA